MKKEPTLTYVTNRMAVRRMQMDVMHVTRWRNGTAEDDMTRKPRVASD